MAFFQSRSQYGPFQNRGLHTCFGLNLNCGLNKTNVFASKPSFTRAGLHKNCVIHKHYVLHENHVLAGRVQGPFAAYRIALWVPAEHAASGSNTVHPPSPTPSHPGLLWDPAFCQTLPSEKPCLLWEPDLCETLPSETCRCSMSETLPSVRPFHLSHVRADPAIVQYVTLPSVRPHCSICSLPFFNMPLKPCHPFMSETWPFVGSYLLWAAVGPCLLWDCHLSDVRPASWGKPCLLWDLAFCETLPSGKTLPFVRPCLLSNPSSCETLPLLNAWDPPFCEPAHGLWGQAFCETLPSVVCESLPLFNMWDHACVQCMRPCYLWDLAFCESLPSLRPCPCSIWGPAFCQTLPSASVTVSPSLLWDPAICHMWDHAFCETLPSPSSSFIILHHPSSSFIILHPLPPLPPLRILPSLSPSSSFPSFCQVILLHLFFTRSTHYTNLFLHKLVVVEANINARHFSQKLFSLPNWLSKNLLNTLHFSRDD